MDQKIFLATRKKIPEADKALYFDLLHYLPKFQKPSKISNDFAQLANLQANQQPCKLEKYIEV